MAASLARGARAGQGLPLSFGRRFRHEARYRPLRWALRGLGVAALLSLLNFWPVAVPRTPGMSAYPGRHFTVWAEAGDRLSAIWLRSMLEDRHAELDAYLGHILPEGQEGVYLYPNQASLKLRRWGVAGLALESNDYVLDRHGANWLLCVRGPLLPEPALQRLLIRRASGAALDQAFPRAPLWLREGLVRRFDPAERDDEDLSGLVPGFSDMAEADPALFRAGSGPRFSDSLVAFVELRYGRATLVELAKGGDWRSLAGVDFGDVYAQWLAWLRQGRAGDPRLRHLVSLLQGAS